MMIQPLARRFLTPLATLALSAALVNAVPPATAPTTQSATDIPKLIKQLGDDDFHIRLAAVRQLKALGKEALPALLEARKLDDPEVHARVEEVLAELNRPPIDESAVPQAAPGVAGMQSSSISVTNGQRVLDVTQNGRTIHIEDKPGMLYMKVTGLIDGKQATREYKAKSAAELKAEHPKAFALYQQFSMNGVGIAGMNINAQGNVAVQKIQIQINGGGAGAANIAIGPGNAQPANIRDMMHAAMLESRLIRAMNQKGLPDDQQQAVRDLIGKLRQAIPDPQKPDKEKQAQQREYERAADAVRSKIDELKLGNFDALLPPKPQAPKE